MFSADGWVRLVETCESLEEERYSNDLKCPLAGVVPHLTAVMVGEKDMY